MLVDTSVLVRTQDKASDKRQACIEAIRILGAEDKAHICAQVLIEMWSVITRPAPVNGLGFTPSRADIAVGKLIRTLSLLPEPPDIALRWRALAKEVQVSGRQVHDARLVAFMHFHGLPEIVSLNADDFRRYRGITAIHPNDVGELPSG